MEPSAKTGHAFLITYDLIKDKDYKKLIDELKRWNCRSDLLSAWVLPASARTAGLTAQAVLERFGGFIDGDDGLVVVEIADYAVIPPRR